jgi:subtilisin family serine protease
MKRLSSLLALVVATLTALALGAAQGSAARETASDEPSIYIVLLKAPPLAATVTGAKRLDVGSAASRAYLARLATEQNELLGQIGTALGRSVKTVHRYNAVLNGFALQLSPSEAQRVATLPDVARVAPDEEQQLLTDNGPPWIGASGIWDGSATGGQPGTRGEGVVVGVIDTGVNMDHPSFADPGPTDGFNHTNPRGRFFGVCNPGLCNDKLIGAYDFTGTGPDDEIGHGSHTASTAVGNVLDASFVAPTITINRRISGVAPHANLISYKACQVVTGNCLLTGILAAINQATLDEVEVINYSIGGTSADPWSDLDAQAFLNARKAGIFVSVSAGNAGPGAATIGSPADAPWVHSVAAATHDRKFVNALADMTGGTPPPDIKGAGVTSGYGPSRVVYAGAAPYNNPLCNPFPAGTFNGEIVLCDRGTIGRVEKGQNVKNAGGGGMVLANDQPNGDSLIGDAHVLPAVHISFANGNVVKDWLSSGGQTARITGMVMDVAPANGDVTASFSSRGPNPATGDLLKPDVTAPGVDIFAAFNSTIPPGPSPEYGIISGTSMSSPHSAGAAALVRAVHPDWSPDEVKSALMTTAFTRPPGSGSEVHEVLKEDSTTVADPFDMGGGRVELRRAARAGLVLDETGAKYDAANPGTGGDPRTLNLASLADDSCAGTCTWTRVLKGTRSTTWNVATSASPGLALSVSDSSFSLAEGDTKAITVTANVNAGADSQWHFGQIVLVADDSAIPEAHLTVAAKKSGGGIQLTTLHFHGNTHDGCSGIGGTDATTPPPGCRTTLSTNGTLDGATAATFTALPGLGCTPASGGRCAADPNWTWDVSGPTTLNGPMTVEWWVNCPGCNAGFFDDWFIRLWADGTQVFQGRVRFNTILPASTTRLQATVSLPELTASDEFVLQLDPIFVNQASSSVLYDSTQACTPANPAPCDSVVHMPVVSAVPGNRAPVAVDDAASVDPGGSVDVPVLANDSDPDGDPLTIQSFTQGANGTVTEPVPGTLRYMHNDGSSNSDSFTYTASDGRGGTDTATVEITVRRPDLVVSNITHVNNTGGGPRNNQPRSGEKVTIVATIANNGNGGAPPTRTEFLLDGTTVLGLVETPAIPAGGTASVSVQWDTRGVQGEHVITVTADKASEAIETNETNNAATYTVTVQGNKVKNGSFEQSSSGTAPDNWSSSGETGYGQGGSDGEKSVTTGPTGSWLSDAIDVEPGRSYDFVVDATGAGGTVTLEQLSAAGAVVGTLALPVAASPLGVFNTVMGTLTIADGVAQVRVRLAGSLTGTAGFDKVELWER